jgi:hypothetical protein
VAVTENSLVKVVNGALVFGDAVARIAESLSPLGVAGRLIAESCACLVEMRELGIEDRKVQSDGALQMAWLENRRAESSESLRMMRDRVAHADLNAQELRRVINDMRQRLVKPRVSLAETKLSIEAIRVVSEVLLEQHSRHGVEVVESIDRVLNGSRPAAVAPAPVDPSQRRSARARPRRPHR